MGAYLQNCWAFITFLMKSADLLTILSSIYWNYHTKTNVLHFSFISLHQEVSFHGTMKVSIICLLYFSYVECEILFFYVLHNKLCLWHRILNCRENIFSMIFREWFVWMTLNVIASIFTSRKGASKKINTWLLILQSIINGQKCTVIYSANLHQWAWIQCIDLSKSTSLFHLFVAFFEKGTNKIITIRKTCIQIT